MITSFSRQKNISPQDADADTTIIQDSGTTLLVFPLEVYFVGENGDQADIFQIFQTQPKNDTRHARPGT